MQIRKVVGQGATALKYDILTALLVLAAQGEPVTARLALRLSLIITARYDWQREKFNVGLRELARMWGVTERTAKREMAQLRALNWITVSRAAARGRVTEHRINIETVLQATLPLWHQIGPDFAARLSQKPEPAPSNVVPLHPVAAPVRTDDGVWSKTAIHLHKADPQIYQAWFAKLVQVAHDGNQIILTAPSGFIASYVNAHFATYLLTYLTLEDRTITSVLVMPPK